MSRRRWITVLGAVGATWMLLAQPAAAHGDDVLVDETRELEAGATVTYSGELHYHRLAGRFSADGPIAVRLVDARTGDVRVSRGPGTELTANELVRCCDDDVWAPHDLVIENRSDRPVTVDASARLVHDDLAVMVDGAESGTRVSIVVLGALLAWRLWRARRDDRPPTSLGRATLALGALTALTLGLGALGAWRYGVGGAPAVVAGGGTTPIIPANPIVSRASLLMGVAIFGWGFAAVRWARSAPTADPRRWRFVGAAFALAPVVTAIAVADAYGAALPPAAMALAAAGPVTAVLVMSAARPRRLRTEAPAETEPA